MLVDYARQKAKWLKNPEIHFKGPQIVIKGSAKGIPLEVKLSLATQGETLQTHLDSQQQKNSISPHDCGRNRLYWFISVSTQLV